MVDIRVLDDKCTGCGLCLGACPFSAIVMDDLVARITDACTFCGACVDACPFEAILLEREAAPEVDNSDYSGIMVYAERSRSVGLELLGEGRRLAKKLNCQVYAVSLGDDAAKQASSLIAHGADVVLTVADPRLNSFNDELHAHVLTALIEKRKPEIVLVGATTYGRSLAPRVAARLKTGLTADCTVLDIEEGTGILLQTRPAFGGNLMATIVCRDRRPQMASVRPGVMKSMPADWQRTGLISECDIELPEKLRTRVISEHKLSSSQVSISDAEVVIAVGKGIGSMENVRMAEELARAINGSLGASRAAVDAGWVDYGRQIGQTGKTIAPKLYIACGISGAVQHIAGMAAADTIVAINKDPDAPIFKIAHYGIVGDVREVLPELVKAIRERT
ncbi:MAG TPA: electron transfer flavoprotein subunit alpha [Bacillota bacterium]|nr:electron transfer flavoprotein subunit alpha [Bacillota bacterium]